MRKNVNLPNILLLLTEVLISALLITKIISVEMFSAISGVAIILFVIFFFDKNTISEISIGGASIKRDLRAAEHIQKDIHATQEEISNTEKKIILITKHIVRISTLLDLGSSSFFGTLPDDQKTIKQEIDGILRIIEPDETKWKEIIRD
jgi:hypothetical protein